MRILIVANHNPGHFIPFVVEQMNALQELGCEVDAFGIEGKGYWGYLKNLPALKRKIKEFRPDFVHAHFGLSGLLATLQSEVPVVITFHNGETLHKSVNLLSSIGAMRAKHVIYVAQHIRDLSYYKAKNYSIIPCGINLSDCQPMPQQKIREELGLSPSKKYILFGGAFANLRKNYPLLREAINLLPNKTNIECLEMRGLSRLQCTQLMNAVDVFALPSKSEGSPQALKEAMACNCPVVATDIADIAHLMGDLEGHYLCSFSPEDVAGKLQKAIDFNGRTQGRQRMIELGFDNKEVAQKVLEVYKNLSAD